MSGSTAIVAIGKDSNGISKAVLVNLTNPTQPQIAGEISGVGTRLALTDSNLLVSTYRTYLAGVNNSLQGLHVAALGNLALVEFDPAVIVVGESGYETAEKFKVKYRVVPGSAEVRSSKIQWRIGETTHSEVPAPMTDGRGELDIFPLGYDIPRSGNVLARPRLVINPGEADEIVGPVKAWKTEKPKVRFEIDQDPATVTADKPEALANVTSGEWYRRYERAIAQQGTGESRAVDWQAMAPASALPAQTRSEAGIFPSLVQTGTAPGSWHEVEARVGGVLLGRAQVEVQAGPAALVTLTADRTSLPADGATEVVVTLEAKDAAGNPVADGTGVRWQYDMDGLLVEAEPVTSAGKAKARYRAGLHETGTFTLEGLVDGEVGELELSQESVTITLVPSRTQVSGFSEVVDLEAQLTSAGGEVSDQASLVWAATGGRIEVVGSLSAGLAHARWTPLRETYLEQVNLKVQMGPWKGEQVVLWSPGTGGPAMTSAHVSLLSPVAIAGDRSADGVESFVLWDGTVESVPVKATAVYRMEGLTPGTRVTLQLGSSLRPNVAPILHYDAEDYDVGGPVVDLTGAHDGTANSGVLRSQAGLIGAAFRFGSGGLITVPSDADFEFAGGFMVQTAVKPPPGGGSQALVEKAGEYRLAIEESGGELRAVFAVMTSEGEVSVVSTRPVPEGAWSRLSGRYQGGRLWIGVDESEVSVPLSAAPLHGPSEIRIGSGFVGELDEIRLFDLGRSPLATFGNGQQSLSFVADGTGSFSTEIRATGVLGQAAYYKGSKASGEETYGSMALNEVVSILNDEVSTQRNPFVVATAQQLLLYTKLAQGIFGTTVRENDWPVVAGHVLVMGAALISLFPCGACQVLWIPLSMLDVVSLGDHFVSNQLSGWDALNVLSLTQLARPLARGIQGTRILGKLDRVEDLTRRLLRLPRTNPALRGSAQTLSKAVKEIVANPEAPARLKALLEGPLSDTAKETVVHLLGHGGMLPVQMARLDSVVHETGKVEETLAVLKQLSDDVGGGIRYRNVLEAAANAVQHGQALSVAAVETLGKIEKVLVAQRGKGIGARINHLAANGVDGVPAKEILEKVGELLGEVGTDGKQAPERIHQMLLDLGAWWGPTAQGALGELTAAHKLVKMQGFKLLEVQKRHPLGNWWRTAFGFGRARETDLVLVKDNVTYFAEVKRWKVLHGPESKFFLDAADQMQRDLVTFVSRTPPKPLSEMRWYFLLGVGPNGGLKPGDLPTLQKRFADALDHPELSKALMEVFNRDKTRVEAAIKELKSALNTIVQGI